MGWPADEVARLNAARIAGKSNDEIRASVVMLKVARKAAKQQGRRVRSNPAWKLGRPNLGHGSKSQIRLHRLRDPALKLPQPMTSIVATAGTGPASASKSRRLTVCYTRWSMKPPFRDYAIGETQQAGSVTAPTIVPRPDFKTTAAAALAAADAVLSHWLPDGKHNGHEYQALNPTRERQPAGKFQHQHQHRAMGRLCHR